MEENMVVNSVTTEDLQMEGLDSAAGLKEMKKTAAKIGWKYAIFGVAVTILQIVYGTVLPESMHDKSWAQFMNIILPMYVLGYPLLLLLTLKMPVTKLKRRKWDSGNGFFVY